MPLNLRSKGMGARKFRKFKKHNLKLVSSSKKAKKIKESDKNRMDKLLKDLKTRDFSGFVSSFPKPFKSEVRYFIAKYKADSLKTLNSDENFQNKTRQKRGFFLSLFLRMVVGKLTTVKTLFSKKLDDLNAKEAVKVLEFIQESVLR